VDRELSTMEQVEVIEEVSRANASLGWCVMIGCDSGFVVGYLDDRVARKLFPRLEMVTAGNFSPTGRAERVGGGYKGQWTVDVRLRHHYADFAMSTCIIFENGAPVMNAGVPVSRRMVPPASAYEIVDNCVHHRQARNRQ
jgi:indole-3-acetate monooxygenase